MVGMTYLCLIGEMKMKVADEIPQLNRWMYYFLGVAAFLMGLFFYGKTKTSWIQYPVIIFFALLTAIFIGFGLIMENKAEKAGVLQSDEDDEYGR